MDVTATILAVLPVGVIFFLYIINREYIQLLWSKESNSGPIPCGYTAIGLAIVLIISGYFTIKKMGNIEV